MWRENVVSFAPALQAANQLPARQYLGTRVSVCKYSSISFTGLRPNSGIPLLRAAEEVNAALLTPTEGASTQDTLDTLDGWAYVTY